jgi:hypothetical protein
LTKIDKVKAQRRDFALKQWKERRQGTEKLEVGTAESLPSPNKVL